MATDEPKKSATPAPADETADHGISTEALGIGAHGDVEFGEEPADLDISKEALGIGVSTRGPKPAD